MVREEWKNLIYDRIHREKIPNASIGQLQYYNWKNPLYENCY
jgi:hypothetical protein